MCDDQWKWNRKGAQLENEIYQLKKSACRVSKRLVLLENFIKNKFPDELEFPTSAATNRVSNKNKADSSSKNNNADKSKTTRSKNVHESKEDGEVFLMDSNGNPIDWESNVITGDIRSPPEIPRSPKVQGLENKLDNFDGVDEGSSPVKAEIEIEHQDHDEDYEVISSASYEIVDKTEEEAVDWLMQQEQSSNDDEDYKPSSKGKSKNSKRIQGGVKSTTAGTKRAKKGSGKYPIHTAKCTICEREFKGTQANGNLRAHMDIHSAVRKYSCTICEKAFRQKRPLRTHMQRVHETEKYAIHLCKFCGKKFVTPRERMHHERTHTGEKPYQCNICTFTCIQAHNLVRHKTIHLGNKDVLCPECGKAFSNDERLRAHSKNVHEVEVGPDGKRLKNVLCELCGLSFVSKDSRRSHLSKVHGVKPTATRIKPELREPAYPEKQSSEEIIETTEVPLE